jgi:molecular chaperone HtpG
VLIKERFEDLLPVYLRFVKGVVDSPDLPLTISRELVQQDRHIAQMRRWLTRKVLDHLNTIQAADDEKYLTFWKGFGRVLKEGVSADADNREKILPLLRFPSSHDETKLTTLADYVSRMKPDQEHIYYLTGDSRAVVESSPHLEALNERGYEVLYLIDPVDELVTQALTEFEEKKLRSAAKGTVELGSEEEKKKAKEALEAKQKDFEALIESLAKPLESWVKEVRLTQRLTASPACLVGTELDMSPQLEKMLRQIEGGPEMGPQKRILELNPSHELIERMRARQAENADDERLADDAYLLYGYALLAEGSELPDPARFSRLLADLMASRG